jgi:thioredoxin reductase
MRAERPFRLLVDTPSGEQTFDADIVLDATGGYVHALPFGPGGLPARGASAAAPNMIRSLGELAIRRGDLRGKRILVVGHGHSAANAINALVDAGDDVRITWAVRTANRRPCQEVACDPLPERQRVVDRANELAESPPRFLSVERRAMIDEIVRDNGHLRVSLTSGRMLEVDAIAAFTGFRPDDAHIKELVVETSSVTEGGARLYRAISNITDCLSVPRLNRHDLESGEPDFYFVGARGYGRARSFLLQSGLAQIETIVEGLRK